jgi:hypothetical protein
MAHLSTRRVSPSRLALVSAVLAALMGAGASGSGSRFYDDDPISSEPDTGNAADAKRWEISQLADIVLGLLTDPGEPGAPPRALNVNTVDAVPDSSWFVNRVGRRSLSIDELVRGPDTDDGPAPGAWTIVASKREGSSPGFTVRDGAGTRWFLKFDPAGRLEASTGAEVVASKILWALGYFVAEDHITELRRDQLRMDRETTIEAPSGRRRRMTMNDVDRVLRASASQPNGAYRVFASKAVPGQPIGGFRFHGTRPDDPNDIVPHEHRRELRALRVFGAWINLVDLRASNTLDTVVAEGGRALVRHHLLDVGSAFGTGVTVPHRWEDGYAHFVDFRTTLLPLLTLGFHIRPWLTIPYEEHPAIGIFEAAQFVPDEWKPRVTNAAYLRALPDDKFWAARRVMAFTDDLLRAVVKTGRYSDPAAERHLAEVLMQRRDVIGRTYLPAINPLVDFALDEAGALSFANAAVDANVAGAPGGYRAVWARFANATGETTPIGAETTSRDTRMQAPAGLPTAIGEYIRVDVSATAPPHESWVRPVQIHFRRLANGWRLVGVDRLP